jgi:hypothetical protein
VEQLAAEKLDAGWFLSQPALQNNGCRNALFRLAIQIQSCYLLADTKRDKSPKATLYGLVTDVDPARY